MYPHAVRFVRIFLQHTISFSNTVFNIFVVALAIFFLSFLLYSIARLANGSEKHGIKKKRILFSKQNLGV